MYNLNTIPDPAKNLYQIRIYADSEKCLEIWPISFMQWEPIVQRSAVIQARVSIPLLKEQSHEIDMD
jgi:hypothetical protein